MEKVDMKQYIKQYLLLLCGLATIAFGVGLSIKAELGTSPISSVPHVVSMFTPLSVGTATIVLHTVLVLLQIVILRRNYQPIQLLQLAVAAVFGYMTDFALWVERGITYSSYFQQWLLCLAGSVLIAIGVTLEVRAKAITLAAEGLSLAICQTTKIKFGNMKVIMDVSLVTIAALLSLIFLHELRGVREGTVAAAILVGLMVKQIQKLLNRIWPQETT